jgi:hypothetical protein
MRKMSEAAAKSAGMKHIQGPDDVSKGGRRFRTTLCGIRFRHEKFMGRNVSISPELADCDKCRKVAAGG